MRVVKAEEKPARPTHYDHCRIAGCSHPPFIEGTVAWCGRCWSVAFGTTKGIPDDLACAFGLGECGAYRHLAYVDGAIVELAKGGES